MPSTTVIPLATAAAAAGEVLQEYADNRGVALRVDREKGIIHGVKLLGAVSKKGREYPKAVMAKALPMYEGMRVNVDHVDPGQRRSLRDRIGLVKNVTLKEDGLYGDFHFNPKHALAEQIAWDAENAPQNLGFSHDTRGQSRNVGGRIVVESIDKVSPSTLWPTRPRPLDCLRMIPTQPIPLARPGDRYLRRYPRTHGAQRHAMERHRSGRHQGEPSRVARRLAGVVGEDRRREERPWKSLEEELKTLKAEKAARELQEAIAGELKAAGLDPANKAPLLPRSSWKTCTATADAAQRKAKIDDRKALVAASKTTAAPTTGAARSRRTPMAAIPPATAPLAQRTARDLPSERTWYRVPST